MSEFVVVDTDSTTVAKAVVNGLTAELQEAAKEQRLHCVQCDQEYRESTNGPKSCSFHLVSYDSWKRSFPCCSQNHPCQYNTHRAEHHSLYPYSKFFERSAAILNYVDTTEEWTSISDVNLETDDTQKASVSQLKRWVSRGSLITTPTILIRVGRVWMGQKYFFETYTAPQLVQINETVTKTKNTLLFTTSEDPSADEYTKVEWVLSQDGTTISGVKLTGKAATSPLPFIHICPIDIATCTKSGDVEVISKGGIYAYTPQAQYRLPKTIRTGPELSDKPVRDLRTFKTRTSLDFPVILKCSSDPPLVANKDRAHTEWDNFQGTLSIFNKHPPKSDMPITIESISAEYRLVGSDTYLPVQTFKVLDHDLPISIDPRQTAALRFYIEIPRTEEDKKLEVGWWNRAFVSRHSPLRVKLNVKDIEEEEASLVIEHIHTPYELDTKADNDIDFFFFDDPEAWARRHVHVEKPWNESEVLRFNGNEIVIKKLQQIVYKSLKSGGKDTEFEVTKGEKDDWEWRAFALVDISCQRVYAFKVLIKGKKYATLGYVACPDYGDVSKETRPIRYATETVYFPSDLGVHEWKEVANDDTVDDSAPDSARSFSSRGGGVGAGGGQGATVVIPEQLTERLNSIDNNLGRLATAVEQLVGLLNSRHNHIMSYMG